MSIPYMNIQPILNHQLKEHLIQTFFRGSVLAVLRGTVEDVPVARGKEDRAFSTFKVAPLDEEKAKKVFCRQNLCYIIASDRHVLKYFPPMGLQYMIFRICL